MEDAGGAPAAPAAAEEKPAASEEKPAAQESSSKPAASSAPSDGGELILIFLLCDVGVSYVWG